MPEPIDAGRRRICRPGGPTALVLGGAIVLILIATATAVVDARDSSPQVQYGPFGDGDVLLGAGVLTAILLVGVWWTARGLTTRGLSLTLLLMVAVGPICVGLALLDSLGPDWFDSTSPALAMILLVVAPLVTLTGVVAIIAEVARATMSDRRA